MEKILSIAVPAYNMEAFLDRCLRSLLNGTVLEELEVLVVDDGSSDGTAKIARKYEREYPHVFRLLQKENGGHGSAVNKAIERAHGRYFKVLDADDWIVTENLPALLSTLKAVRSDAVVANYHMVDARGRFRQAFRTEGVEFGRRYSIAEWMKRPKEARACSTFHGLIYRTDFYRGTGLKLTENIYYEDQEYASLPFFYAESVCFVNLFFYQYLVGRKGQSVSHENQARCLGQIESILWNIARFYQSHPRMPPEKQEYLLYKMAGIVLSYYVAALLKNPDRKQGRRDAQRLRETLEDSFPELRAATEKKYWISTGLYWLHLTPDGLERIKRTRFYYLLKKWL